MYRSPNAVRSTLARAAAGLTLGVLAACAAANARACGGSVPAAQIETGGSLYVFPGFGQIDVTGTAGTASTANSWRVGWYGGAGVTHFSGRLVDADGGMILLANLSSGSSTQPSPYELDFAQTFDLSMEQGVEYIDFISSGRSIELLLDADAFYIISYPIPGNVEAHPQTNPFGLSFDAAPAQVIDRIGNVFCDGFE